MSTRWMLESESQLALIEAMNRGSLPQAQELADYEAKFEAVDGVPRIMTLTGTKAHINVTGLLTGKPNFFAQFFGSGNTTYSEIIASAKLVDSNPAIESATMFVDSPGGEASSAWKAAMDAVKAIKKPVTAIVGNMAASAAFGIASQANEIFAENELSKVGSIGVVTSIAKKGEGNTIEIVSKNAPNKRPDPETPEGKAAVLETINAIEDIFIGAVAAGRDTTTEKVIADFGKGGIVMAKAAIGRNMIDGIVGEDQSASSSSTSTTAQAGNKPKEIMKMNLIELQAQHPSLIAEARQAGVDSERTRVNAHLKMGKSSGATEIASKAIADGVPFADVQADYSAYFMDNFQKNAESASETEDLNDATDGAGEGTEQIIKKGSPEAKEDANADEAANMIAEALGVASEGDAE